MVLFGADFLLYGFIRKEFAEFWQVLRPERVRCCQPRGRDGFSPQSPVVPLEYLAEFSRVVLELR